MRANVLVSDLDLGEHGRLDGRTLVIVAHGSLVRRRLARGGHHAGVTCGERRHRTQRRSADRRGISPRHKEAEGGLQSKAGKPECKVLFRRLRTHSTEGEQLRPCRSSTNWRRKELLLSEIPKLKTACLRRWSAQLGRVWWWSAARGSLDCGMSSFMCLTPAHNHMDNQLAIGTTPFV